ncbi:Core-binding (CB) domain-containing protein [Tenacibaculum sp. 190524A02b]|uniref:Core-binding (CB) domain-containing protein n=1 Tax=Tenacibaculum vairaonense TaxID=3137860 RepID=A0ABM9PL09_9FLAO
MKKLSLLLTTVHDSVHYLEKMKEKKKYSDPEIYTGGVDIKKWNKLPQEQKKKALKRQWYVRWSFRNPETGNLERQPNIKAGNIYKTKEERLEILETIKRNLFRLLKDGLINPYDDTLDDKTHTVKEAIEYALKLKKKTQDKTSFGNYETRINRFKDYLLKNGFENRYITSVKKSHVVDYLNTVLLKTSASNRNNDRGDISSLFGLLYDNEIIKDNFVSKIPNLKSQPKKNKAFSQEEVKDIFEKAKEKDIWLYYFLAHVYYGLFRNIEVVRIEVSHINIDKKIIESNTKTGHFYKQIPQILIDEFYSKYDFSNYPNNYFLFTKDNQPSLNLNRNNESTSERDRRGYWGKRFTKTIRKPMGFSQDYTIYSMRHAAIGRLFIETITEYKNQGVKNFEEKALDFIRSITAHTNNETVKKYLREIGYYLIEDWSTKLK